MHEWVFFISMTKIVLTKKLLLKVFIFIFYSTMCSFWFIRPHYCFFLFVSNILNECNICSNSLLFFISIEFYLCLFFCCEKYIYQRIGIYQDVIWTCKTLIEDYKKKTKSIIYFRLITFIFIKGQGWSCGEFFFPYSFGVLCHW